MGYHARTLTVYARVSRHNDERDREHDEAWARLVEEVRGLCDKPEYQEIDASTGLAT